MTQNRSAINRCVGMCATEGRRDSIPVQLLWHAWAVRSFVEPVLSMSVGATFGNKGTYGTFG